jgi:hypothetical protein
MKPICIVLGLALIAVAVVYLMIPADALPGFFPGHETGLMRVRYKHGIASGVAGLVLMVAGWLLRR